MTAVPNWQPGKLYQPGALVIPRASTTLTNGVLNNGDFEAGDTGWIIDSPPYWAIKSTTDGFGSPFQGTHYAQFAGPTHGSINVERQIVNTKIVAVTPGQVISIKAMISCAPRPQDAGAAVAIFFWDSTSSGGYGSPGAVLVQRQGGSSINGSVAYQPSTYTAVAPPSAAYAQFCVNAYGSNYPADINIDACSWDYAGITAPTGLVFKAVQANAATSASTEPVWPTILGNTVVDGGVTWEAVQSTQVTWEASPILLSGSTEPTWSTDVGGTVSDNTIAWKAISRRITDSRCPNTIAVAIAASKVFAGDKDIIAFSETVNPLDWSTANDAGYLPFGLQTYGSSPVTALGLYRSNLVAFNAAAFQMWQVDQDPANMALLDAVPVGCIYPKSTQPLANDLVFLSVVGVRNVSIAGASTNLQAGGIGEPIDPLVVAQIRAGIYDPISLFFPAAGQYWLIFGPQAFVLTITSSKTSSWSRYIFPSAITDWTLMGSDLYLRSGTSIWHFTTDALYDDIVAGIRTMVVDTNGDYVGFDSIQSFGSLDVPGLYGEIITSIKQAFTGSNTGDFILSITNTSGLTQNLFSELQIFSIDTGEFITVLNSAEAVFVPGVPGVDQGTWTWSLPSTVLIAGESVGNYAIGFDDEAAIDFTGIVQWPHLDMGQLGIEKNMIGIDLIADAPNGVTFSVGYDQRDLTKRTAAYPIDADTLPGPLLPIPVSGPSFDLRLEFGSGQAWEHIAANLYIK